MIVFTSTLEYHSCFVFFFKGLNPEWALVINSVLHTRPYVTPTATVSFSQRLERRGPTRKRVHFLSLILTSSSRELRSAKSCYVAAAHSLYVVVMGCDCGSTYY